MQTEQKERTHGYTKIDTQILEPVRHEQVSLRPHTHR